MRLHDGHDLALVGAQNRPVPHEPAERAGLGNVDFRAGRVEELLPDLLAEGFCPDLVTLNPPRRGADPPL